MDGSVNVDGLSCETNNNNKKNPISVFNLNTPYVDTHISWAGVLSNDGFGRIVCVTIFSS